MKTNKLELTYIGNDGWDRPVYENEERLFVDTDPRASREPRICTKYRNAFDGEPDTPIEWIERYKDVKLKFIPNRVTW